MGLAGVVMAAGEGTRMRSRIPKPLHKVCGKEMVRYPVELLRAIGAERIVVVVSRGNAEEIWAVLGNSVEYALQPSRDGTGGAVACCGMLLHGKVDRVLVIGGDSPLVVEESVAGLLQKHISSGSQMTVLTAPADGRTDLGRVVAEDDRVTRIVEAADAGAFEDARATRVNAGVYCFDGSWLWRALGQGGAKRFR